MSITSCVLYATRLLGIYRCVAARFWFHPLMARNNGAKQDAIDAVVNSSFWPISIFMESLRARSRHRARLKLPQVGVGTASFAVMQDVFDSDTEPLLSSTGQVACRDNVQFVSLRDYSDNELAMCRVQRARAWFAVLRVTCRTA